MTSSIHNTSLCPSSVQRSLCTVQDKSTELKELQERLSHPLASSKDAWAREMTNAPSVTKTPWAQHAANGVSPGPEALTQIMKSLCQNKQFASLVYDFFDSTVKDPWLSDGEYPVVSHPLVKGTTVLDDPDSYLQDWLCDNLIANALDGDVSELKRRLGNYTDTLYFDFAHGTIHAHSSRNGTGAIFMVAFALALQKSGLMPNCSDVAAAAAGTLTKGGTDFMEENTPPESWKGGKELWQAHLKSMVQELSIHIESYLKTMQVDPSLDISKDQRDAALDTIRKAMPKAESVSPDQPISPDSRKVSLPRGKITARARA